MADPATFSGAAAFPRLAPTARIRCAVIDDPDAAFERAGLAIGHARNISGGGVRFVAREPFELGTAVAVRLEPAEVDLPVLAYGRVVACDPLPPGRSGVEIAVAFYWTGWAAAEVQSALQALVASRLR